VSDAERAAFDTAGGRPSVRAVLFDLDGTLVDLRTLHSLAPLPYTALRPLVGSGARGMVGAGFGVAPGEARFDALRDAFLTRYAERLLQATTVFEGMTAVLPQLEAAGLRWGIVTNKAMRYALPVCEGLGLAQRAAVLIAGDTTPHAKPHPEPLLEAARRLALAPGHCVYVGDDERDIVAGRAAGMATVAAAWGYLGAGRPLDEWGADVHIDTPQALLNWLDLA
jgi:N-acetyl-D-muramate 6-phosphate phosphatase